VRIGGPKRRWVVFAGTEAGLGEHEGIRCSWGDGLGAHGTAKRERFSMVKHIVMWRLKDEAQGQNRKENAQQLKTRLEALAGKIPGLRKFEVGFDFSNTPDSSDAVLYSEFDSKEALAAYQEHPQHKAVQAFVKEIRLERRIVDYEC
jgi:heme-degrading monooxygenase HmoA